MSAKENIVEIGFRFTKLEINPAIAAVFAAALAACGGSDDAATRAAPGSVLKPMSVACNAGTSNSYELTMLDSLGGSKSFARAINNRGQVVGASQTSDNSVRAVIWNGAAVSELGTVNGEFSVAYDINNAGQVVGYMSRSGIPYPATWSGASGTYLEAPAGGGVAYAINASGLITGTRELVLNTADLATLWTGGTFSDLGTLGGAKRVPAGINEAGDIVGYTTLGPSNYTEHAALWKNGAIVDLGGLGEFDSHAKAINNRGQIVGYSTTAQGNGTHAVLWHQGAITDLGTLGGQYGIAWSLNNAGQIIGVSTGADEVVRPTLWSGTTVVDLSTRFNTSGTGVFSARPVDINDNGQIALEVTMSDGTFRAAVLTPHACGQ